MLTINDIRSRLATDTFGRELRVYESLGSTNDTAKELAAQGAPEGTVVVALDQRKGRGRQDRSWISEPGKNLTFSVVLRPRIPAEILGLVSLYASAAVAAAVSSLSARTAGCKWPNDVVVGGKKISGILCEATINGSTAGAVVAGIGVNVNQREYPAEIAGTATSIALETGAETGLAAALAALLASLESLYRPADPGWPATVVAEWTARNVVLGSRVEADLGTSRISGIARSVTPSGALRIETPGGTVDLAAGDVHLV
jgi:BirA family transcriptional regulator, biotin operon repressor / biotin---[acetyl-CoA-carboxylase] ligase